MNIEKKIYFLSPGSSFFIDYRKPHYYRSNKENWEHSVLHFDGSISHQLFEEFSKDNNVLFYEQTGFVSINNFNRLFLEHTGLTPSEFRCKTVP